MRFECIGSESAIVLGQMGRQGDVRFQTWSAERLSEFCISLGNNLCRRGCAHPSRMFGPPYP